LGAANSREPAEEDDNDECDLPPAGPCRPEAAAPAIPFTNGQLNALCDRRARAIVEMLMLMLMLMLKANSALKLQGKRVVIVGLDAGLGQCAEGSLKSAVTLP
jgi:hypothetical protein